MLLFTTLIGTNLAIIPTLVYHVVGRFKKNTDLQTFCAVAAAFVWFPLSIVEDARLTDEFNRTAVKVSAVVTYEEYRKTKYEGWYIQLTYHAEGATYETEMLLDEKNRYAVDYVLNLYYLKEFPNQYGIDLHDGYYRINGVSRRIR